MSHPKKLHELLLELNFAFRTVVCDMWAAHVPRTTFEMTKTVNIEANVYKGNQLSVRLVAGDLNVTCLRNGDALILPDELTLSDFIYSIENKFDTDDFINVVGTLNHITNLILAVFAEFDRMMVEQDTEVASIPDGVLIELKYAEMGSYWISLLAWLEEHRLAGVDDGVKYVVTVVREHDGGNVMLINDQLSFIAKPDNTCTTSHYPADFKIFMKTVFSSVDDDTTWPTVLPLVDKLAYDAMVIWPLF